MTKKECKKDERLKWNKDTKKCDRKRKQKQLKKHDDDDDISVLQQKASLLNLFYIWASTFNPIRPYFLILFRPILLEITSSSL